MRAITRSRGGSVPVARRQLAAEPAKLIVTVVAVAAAVALVLLLSGLRRGMGEQVTLYIDHQAPVLVGQRDARDFLSQTSVLPEALSGEIALARRQDLARLLRTGDVVSYILVRARPRTPVGELAARIDASVPGATASTRETFARSERRVVGEMTTDIVQAMILVGVVIGVAVAALSPTAPRSRNCATTSSYARWVYAGAARSQSPSPRSERP